MTYNVRQYGTRQYGDGTRVSTTVAGPPGALDTAAGASLTFGGTGTLLTTPPLSGSAAVSLTLSGTGTLTNYASLVSADPNTSPADKLKFAGYGFLHVEVPVVAPPSTLTYVKRRSFIMPTPVLDSRGRPT